MKNIFQKLVASLLRTFELSFEICAAITQRSKSATSHAANMARKLTERTTTRCFMVLLFWIVLLILIRDAIRSGPVSTWTPAGVAEWLRSLQ